MHAPRLKHAHCNMDQYLHDEWMTLQCVIQVYQMLTCRRGVRAGGGCPAPCKPLKRVHMQAARPQQQPWPEQQPCSGCASRSGIAGCVDGCESGCLTIGCDLDRESCEGTTAAVSTLNLATFLGMSGTSSPSCTVKTRASESGSFEGDAAPEGR